MAKGNKEEVVAPPSLDVSDVQSSINLIDVSVKRGTFAGEEIMAVAQLRERLKTFVDYVVETKAQEEAKEETK